MKTLDYGMVLLEWYIPLVCFYLNTNLQVQNNEADFGVSNFACSHSRSTVVTCSVPMSHALYRWYSRAPQILPPATNLIRIFTFYVWFLIFLSMVLFSIFLLIAAKIGRYYGLSTESYEDFLVPFRQAIFKELTLSVLKNLIV